LPTQHQKTRWEKIRDHPVTWMIGLIAALLAIGSAVWDALRYPEISAEATANPLLPFDTYFAVANGSTLFAMRDTQIFCGIDKVELIGGGGFQSFSVTDSKHATIEPAILPRFDVCLALQVDRRLSTLNPDK